MSLPLVIGSSGFIGKHLHFRLHETHDDVLTWHPVNGLTRLVESVRMADEVYHVAGATRDAYPMAWEKDLEVTRRMLKNLKPTAKVVYASSEQAGEDSHYGTVKQQSEIEIAAWGRRNPEGSVFSPRLSKVFGKWAKPYHNSIVATWCQQIVNGGSLNPVTNPKEIQKWLHIDSVIDALLSRDTQDLTHLHLTAQEVRDLLQAGYRDPYAVEANVWASTVWSYEQPMASTTYTCVDDRGILDEFSVGAGQVNYLTIKPGAVRGGHYHHNRIESFVLFGADLWLTAQHVLNSTRTLKFKSDRTEPMTVVIPPGWKHELVNKSQKTQLVLLKTNDVFDPAKPDTIKEGLV